MPLGDKLCEIKAAIVRTVGETGAKAKEWLLRSPPQNFQSSYPEKLVKMIDNTKELVFMWIVSIDVYLIKN